MRLAILIYVLLISTNAMAAESLAERVQKALYETAGASLPPEAQITLVKMTPVKGHAEEIEITRYDLQSGYFAAILRNGSVAREVTGRARAELPVIVPTRYLRREDIIASGDLVREYVSLAMVPKDSVMSVDEAIGMSATQTLVPGRPIRIDTLAMPSVINRNDIVTISYTMAHMRLTAKGKALASGAPGSSVPVMPVNSSALLDAVVIAPGHVSVSEGVIP